MFEKIKASDYVINLEQSTLKLVNRKMPDTSLAEIFIDTTDNLLTVKSMQPNIPDIALELLISEIENYGGKQILNIPKKYHSLFEKCNFESNPRNAERLRQTSVKDLKNIKVAASNEENKFISGSKLKNSSEEDIEGLMLNSKFLETKVTQFQERGCYNVFRLMCEYSMPCALTNAEGKLVAFCRMTDIGEDYYLSDTYVDETFFDSKEQGTALLYKQLAENLSSEKRILLIAPPHRVEEFDNKYGCSKPNDLMVNFSDAKLKPNMEPLFESEKNRILGTDRKPTLAY